MNITILDIIKKYMKENGYTGISNGNGCGCDPFDKDDIIPCESDPSTCFVCYKVKAHCDDCKEPCEDQGETEYCFTEEKPNE